MIRKDCENSNRKLTGLRGRPLWLGIRSVIASAVVTVSVAAPLNAGSVRVWPASVVVDEVVHLVDVCFLSGFDAETQERIARIVVADSPVPGGSTELGLDAIRTALVDNQVNMANVMLRGASLCSITRPSISGPPEPDVRSLPEKRAPDDKAARAESVSERGEISIATPTLREAVVRYFHRELRRYQGEADVVFDRTPAELLGVSGVGFEFKIRRRSAAPLGLIQIEVDLHTDGAIVQTVPLVVKVAMTRRVAIAHRSINQGATLRASDIEIVPITFTRLDRIGIVDLEQVFGKRAKRFIATGSIIRPDELEDVPLVARGQIVQLTSREGAVQIVTTGKAMRSGLLGETITVRSLDRRRTEFDATIVGPGAVVIGSGLATPSGRRQAARGRS